MSSSSTASSRILIKSVALPSEHGSWGFLLEPIILGLLVASSGYGWLLALSAFATFLVHQPLKIVIKDRLKHRRPPRTVWAERFTLGYGSAAILFFVTVFLGADPRFLLPLLFAAPLILVQLFYDAQNKSRELLPAITGAAALGSIASSIALLNDWQMLPAFLLWLVLLARSIASILYVRARLKLERSNPVPTKYALFAHSAAVVGLVLLALAYDVPWLAAVGSIILAIRAFLSLSKYRKPRRVVIIGVQELIYGFSYVIITAVGYMYGI